MADFAKEGGGGLRRVAQSQGYTRLQFGENSSFLQSVDVQRLAEPTAAPAVLRLIGEQGHLRCNGLAHAHSEGSARTILRFLGAIRSQPEAETYGGQRAFLAAGLWTVLMASNGTRRV